MKKKLVVLSGFVLGLGSVPVVAFAAPNSCDTIRGGDTTILSIICKINQILGFVVPVLIALGVVYFIWGVISYVIGTDEEQKKGGREKMIYGIIALAVIIGVWGLVGILLNTFDIGPAGIVPPVVPGFNN